MPAPPPSTESVEASVTLHSAEGRRVGEISLAEGIDRFLMVGEQETEEQFLLQPMVELGTELTLHGPRLPTLHVQLGSSLREECLPAPVSHWVSRSHRPLQPVLGRNDLF